MSWFTVNVETNYHHHPPYIVQIVAKLHVNARTQNTLYIAYSVLFRPIESKPFARKPQTVTAVMKRAVH